MKNNNAYSSDKFHTKKDNYKRTNAFISSKFAVSSPSLISEPTSIRNDVLPINKNKNTFLYTELENKTSSYELPNHIIEIIQCLEKELMANLPSDVINEKYDHRQYSTSYKFEEIEENKLNDDVYSNKYKKYQTPKPDIDFNCRIKITDLEYKTAALEQNIMFKPTAKVEAINELDKAIKDIRIILNKMSETKFESQKKAIFDIMNVFFETELYNPFPVQGQDSTDANETNLTDFIKYTTTPNSNVILFAKKLLDVVSVDTFFSTIYSKLYKEWTSTYPEVFQEILLNYIADFNIKIDDEFHYVDSNSDYDGYCKYIKNNDKRKAFSLFIVNLIKLGVVSKDIICMILNHFLDKSIEYVDTANKLNEVEEMSDNIYIIVLNIHTTICSSSEWNDDILPKITQISQMKMKQHVSISNRVLFKYMDIVDILS